MKIVMIGAGNLATHLSTALQHAGMHIVQIYSRSEASAGTLAGLLQTRYTTDLASLDTDASLYIISVSDDAIPQLVQHLPFSEQLVVHTAGSVNMDIFAERQQNYGVLYPLQTFSKARPVDFSAIPVFLEANTPDNLYKIRQIAEKVSDKVYEATSSERVYLHLAAVFGCNFVNYLYHVAAQIAGQAGFSVDALSALMLETAQKAIASGNPAAVQTGPAIRNDQTVIQKHLALLANHPDLQKLYAELTNRIKSD